MIALELSLAEFFVIKLGLCLNLTSWNVNKEQRQLESWR
ncbi:hypothetical protein VCHE40_1187 [Vibrio cholerae HE-40]|nr:hypothetical protein VCHE39_2121 [Vibrio cholerae HE39]EGR08884.1 hypothetical protein VCHE48_2216 [Vibrio cholerae HE48]EKG85743.1 hypothetical protein VCHE16_2531 [Vibrio paracholerae HE-16]EKL31484.1 hypothetical protein VCHE40_1187 [Vibrio cholerae HE-40]EKL36458.1 hypothetical protein VCHE46_1192 [Vibrio cholerae HE-46]